MKKVLLQKDKGEEIDDDFFNELVEEKEEIDDDFFNELIEEKEEIDDISPPVNHSNETPTSRDAVFTKEEMTSISKHR